MIRKIRHPAIPMETVFPYEKNSEFEANFMQTIDSALFQIFLLLKNKFLQLLSRKELGLFFFNQCQHPSTRHLAIGIHLLFIITA